MTHPSNNDGLYKNLLKQVEAVTKHINEGAFQSRARNKTAANVFIQFLAEEFRLQKIANIKPKHIEAWVQHMLDADKATSTIMSHLSGVRHVLDKTPVYKGPFPENSEILALQHIPPRAYTDVERAWADSEYRQMIHLAIVLDEISVARVMQLAHEIGPRIHEALRIDYADAQRSLRTGELKVKGKGGKIRWISIESKPRVMKMLQEAMKDSKPGRRIFTNGKSVEEMIKHIQYFIRKHRGKFELDSRILQKRDGYYLRQMGKKYGYKPHITYHGLRHSFARRTYLELRKQGESHFQACKRVSQLLGHERETITNIYLGELRGGKQQ
ncbi:tyrosine-type recombinase/integrase [Alicyclobacillus sp. SO9]|uniref:tyrosine-type recombinase/integrase n=1 Tax=Alicyclobacillus sp. SO9 TaxID=2665646 RepID=UPI0018E74883|nr:tyrosine-type recombinase/integrase [Alicyclobacillus sp. SO9]QQE81615.1 tyrosine-type recombinase/integrase [Alicyclobacillus sp. SO9]